jgi:hypothetical protein
MAGRLTQYSLDCTWDAEEGNATFEECGNRNLISSIKRDAGRRASLG